MFLQVWRLARTPTEVLTHKGRSVLREMTSRLPSWNNDVISKIPVCQSMRIFLKNIPAKFRPDPIWNDGALFFGVFEQVAQQEDKKNVKNNVHE